MKSSNYDSPTMQLDPGSESREPCLATLLWRSRGTLSCTSWPWTTMDLRRVTHHPLLNWRMTWSLLPWWVAGPQGGPEFSGFEPWVGWDQIKSDQLELVSDVRNRPHLITNIWLVVWNMFLFFHILGIIITTDFHIFQRGWPSWASRRGEPPGSFQGIVSLVEFFAAEDDSLLLQRLPGSWQSVASCWP